MAVTRYEAASHVRVGHEHHAGKPVPAYTGHATTHTPLAQLYPGERKKKEHDSSG